MVLFLWAGMLLAADGKVGAREIPRSPYDYSTKAIPRPDGSIPKEPKPFTPPAQPIPSWRDSGANEPTSVEVEAASAVVSEVEAATATDAGAAKKLAAPASGRRISQRTHNSRFIDRPAAAEKKNDDDAKAEAPSPSSRRLTWWVTTAIGLAIVLGVIAVCGKAVKKLMPGLAMSEDIAPIHMLYRSFLTPKQSVCLLRCGERLLLVGVSGDNMTTLAEITDPVEIDYLKGQCMQVRPKSTTKAFRDLFTRERQQWAETDDSPEEPPPVEKPPLPPTDKPAAVEFAGALNAAREKIVQWKTRSNG